MLLGRLEVWWCFCDARVLELISFPYPIASETVKMAFFGFFLEYIAQG